MINTFILGPHMKREVSIKKCVSSICLFIYLFIYLFYQLYHCFLFLIMFDHTFDKFVIPSRHDFNCTESKISLLSFKKINSGLLTCKMEAVTQGRCGTFPRVLGII